MLSASANTVAGGPEKFEEQPAGVPGAAAPAPDPVKFPDISKGPALFYEDERKEVWLGIPLMAVADPNLLVAAFDRAKWDALQHLARFQQQLIAKAKIEKPKRSIMDILSLKK